MMTIIIGTPNFSTLMEFLGADGAFKRISAEIALGQGALNSARDTGALKGSGNYHSQLVPNKP
jgi:hypothetical protein